MGKKVAIFTSTYNNIYSGVGTYARNLLDGLRDKNYDVFIISPDCDNRPPYFIKIKRPSMSISPNSWFELSFIYRKVLKEYSNRIDVAHFLDAREGLFVKKERDIFLIGSVHDTYSWDLQSKALLKELFLDWRRRLLYYTILFNLEKRAYQRYDLLISNTDYVKGRLIDFYDIEEKKVETVYLPTPTDIKKKDIRNSKEPYLISFIGGNFQRKGLLQLIKAAKRVREEGIDIKIAVAGKDKNQKLIENWIEKNGLGGIVEFKGHLKREEVEALLEKSDIFVMPSITEAFGLVYLEAMAHGVPVIGSKEGGTKELIEDGVNGYLVNPYDINEIAEKIKLSLKGNIRKKLINNSFETVKKFSKEKFIQEMINIYNSLPY